MAFTSLAATGSSSPGATSQNTASLVPVALHGYAVYVSSTRGLSADPDAVSLAGWGQTWTQESDRVFVPSGSTTHRRSQLFTCYAVAPTNGVLTFSYTNTPDTIDWQVIDLGLTATAVHVAASLRHMAASQTGTANTLKEGVTMPAVATSVDRWLTFVTINTNAATLRAEDATLDGGAHQTWSVIATFGSSTTRTRKHISTTITATTDTTPGWLASDNTNCYQVGIEVDLRFPQTWAGHTGTATATGTNGSFTAGTAEWAGHTGTVTATGTNGSFTAGTAVWTGHTATVAAAGVSGSFTAGTAAWTGHTATVVAAGVSGSFTAGSVTWAGHAGTVAISGAAGSFTPGTAAWAGHTATVVAAGVSGSFTVGPTPWTGHTATATAAGVSGSFTAGTAVWHGHTGTVDIDGTTGTFVPGTATWPGHVGIIDIAGTIGSFVPGTVAWVGHVAELIATGIPGTFIALPLLGGHAHGAITDTHDADVDLAHQATVEIYRLHESTGEVTIS